MKFVGVPAVDFDSDSFSECGSLAQAGLVPVLLHQWHHAAHQKEIWRWRQLKRQGL